MHRLITAQLRRLVRQRAFYVCLVLAAALGIGISMLYHYFWTQRGANIAMSYRMMEFYGMDTTVLDEALSVVPKLDIWSFINAFFSDEVKWILSSICVCSLITAEYSSGTVKNSIARGFSRGAIYFSRFIVALAQVFGVSAAYIGAGAITALFFVENPPETPPEEIIICLATYILLLIATASLFLALAVIFRRSGISVAVAIAAPMLILSVMSILTMTDPDAVRYSRFVLMETFVTVAQYISSGEAWAAPVIALIYLAVSYITGFLVFRRSDIR